MASPKSKILESKTSEEILRPTPPPFEWDGQTFEIFPMPDSVLMHVGGALQNVASLFGQLADKKEEVTATEGLSPEGKTQALLATFAPLVGQVVQLLVPNATKVIAGCLRVPEEKVADGMRIAKKLECLRLIVEAEDLPLILKNSQALMEVFTPSALGSFLG